MSQRVAGKVAVVTGAASARGMGFASARALAREGASVLLADSACAEVEKRAEELLASGAKVAAIGADVRLEADWERVFAAAEERFGPVSVLVNNAGVAFGGGIAELTLEDWNRLMEINATGVFLGARRAVRGMRGAGLKGSIINISSVAGIVGLKGGAGYAASKGAVRLFSKALSVEIAAEGIRVNSIHPGAIDTDLMNWIHAADAAQAEAFYATIPMGRCGTAEDIAAMVLFLASDESGYVTGAELIVDGGFTAI